MNKDRVLLVLLSFLVGTCNNLPEQLYIAGLGLFEFFTILYSIYYFGLYHSSININFSGFKIIILPILIILISFYLGNIFGLIKFADYSLADLLEPLRFFFYILFIILISRVCKSLADIYLSIFSCILGILVIAIRSFLKPGDDSFLYGLPVLYDPNVVANLIGYAFIGIALLADSKFRKIAFPLAIIFSFLQFVSFSKAGWMMMILGWLLILITYRVSFKVILLVLLMIHLLFYHFDIYVIIKDAIDLKINAASGAENEVGSFNARLGFLISSFMTFRQYPFGIGNHYFSEIHYQHAPALGALYTDSTSPHSAIGYLLISTGFLGLSAFLFIVAQGVKILGRISNRQGIVLFSIKLLIGTILLLSSFFQIELLSQPFLYMVLGYYFVFKKQLLFTLTDTIKTT